MLNLTFHSKWQLVFPILFVVPGNPLAAQTLSSVAPGQQTAAGAQEIPPAVARELDALRERIAKLEAEFAGRDDARTKGIRERTRKAREFYAQLRAQMSA